MLKSKCSKLNNVYVEIGIEMHVIAHSRLRKVQFFFCTDLIRYWLVS